MGLLHQNFFQSEQVSLIIREAFYFCPMISCCATKIIMSFMHTLLYYYFKMIPIAVLIYFFFTLNSSVKALPSELMVTLK